MNRGSSVPWLKRWLAALSALSSERRHASFAQSSLWPAMRMPFGVPWRWTLDPDEIGDCLKKEMDVKMSGSNEHAIMQPRVDLPGFQNSLTSQKYHLPAGSGL